MAKIEIEDLEVVDLNEAASEAEKNDRINPPDTVNLNVNLEDEESRIHRELLEELQKKRENSGLRRRRSRIFMMFGLLILLLLLFFLLSQGFLKRRARKPQPTEAESIASESELPVESTETEPGEEELRLQEVLSSYTNLGIIACSSYINFRSAPDQQDLTNIMGMLRDGAAVEILDAKLPDNETWAHVRSGGMDGYISNSYLLSGEEAENRVPELISLRATVVADKLRIRTSPEIADGNTVGSAAKGERYEVLEEAGDWVRIKTDNIDSTEDAYMSALSENVSIAYGLDEARSLDLRQKVLNSYDVLGVSKASDYVNVRKTKETGSINNIVGKLPGYAGANILSEEDGWMKIQSGKVTGYVKSEFMATGKEAETLAVSHASVMAIVNTDALNVRSEPGMDSRAWTKIVRDQRYNVINQLDGWVQLDLDSGDDEDSDQGAYVSTRDHNVTVMYALQEAIDYHPAVDAANAAMAKRNQIVNYAVQFVGNPYVWGGTSLTKGADCSGFVLSVLRHFGISVPRTSRAQAASGKKISSKDMRPGDLIFYANRSGTINHVAMYIGNGQVVNAASRRSGIKIARWNYRTPVAIRNVID